jgi:hypothetical protein
MVRGIRVLRLSARAIFSIATSHSGLDRNHFRLRSLEQSIVTINCISDNLLELFGYLQKAPSPCAGRIAIP